MDSRCRIDSGQRYLRIYAVRRYFHIQPIQKRKVHPPPWYSLSIFAQGTKPVAHAISSSEDQLSRVQLVDFTLDEYRLRAWRIALWSPYGTVVRQIHESVVSCAYGLLETNHRNDWGSSWRDTIHSTEPLLRSNSAELKRNHNPHISCFFTLTYRNSDLG